MCDYQGCETQPEFLDEGDNLVCEDCMVREIQDSDVIAEDFEPVPPHQKQRYIREHRTVGMAKGNGLNNSLKKGIDDYGKNIMFFRYSPLEVFSLENCLC